MEKLENNKSEHRAKVEALVEDAEIKLKPSSGNKYVSVTINARMESSRDVVKVYTEAKKIGRIISL